MNIEAPGSMLLHDEDSFFALVRSIPDASEADALLAGARLTLLAEKNRIKVGPEVDAITLTLTRIKEERKVIRESEFRVMTRQGVIELFGQEAWDELRTWMIKHCKINMIRENVGE